MTFEDAIEILQRRNNNYAARKGLTDYVRENEQIINALIDFANERENRFMPAQEKEPFPFAKVYVSGFDNPITNLVPLGNFPLVWIYEKTIISDAFKNITEQLRTITDVAQARKFKADNFPYITFSGTFARRDSEALIRHSNMLMIDFDHVGDVSAIQELKGKLLKDKYFDTLLMFRSPSGDGLKWLINIDITRYSHRCWFDGIYHYVKHTYGLEIDKSGSDIARACFLCHDQQAFINPNIYKV